MTMGLHWSGFRPSWFRATPKAACAPSRVWVTGYLLTFLFLSAGIGTVGYYYFRHQIADSRNDAKNELSAVGNLKVQQILDWRKERLRDAEQIRIDPFAGQSVEEFLAGSASNRQRSSLLVWLGSLQEQNQGLRTLLVDRQMNVRLAFPEDKVDFGPIAQSSASTAMSSNQVVFSDLHRSRFSGAIHLDIAIPIIVRREWPETGTPGAETASARPVAAIVVEVDPRKFLYPCIQNWPTPSQTAETLLVRREGNEIVFLNELRHRTGTALSMRLPIDRKGLPATEAVLGHEGLVEGTDYRNVPVVAFTLPIPGTPWSIVAKVDQMEIYAPLRERGSTTAALVLAFIVMAALGVVYLSRCHDSQRLRGQLAIGREFRLILDSLDEGVLGLDSEGRHVFVNPAACHLLGYEPVELIGKPSHAIWHAQKADGSSYPSHECPIYAALRTGKSCRSNQEVFWRKNGTSFPAEYVATPSLEKDRPVALALVFRDVSEHYRFEEDQALAVQRMESLLALNQMSDPSPDLCVAKVVEDAIRLTRSEIGYIAVLNEDESILTMRYWSQSAHASCKIVDKPIVYPVEKTGLWGEAVRQRKPIITNDYSAPNPHKRGTPQGHVPITRHVSIPVFHGRKIVAVAGVGNKAAEYDEGDVRQLQLLMEGWWQIVSRSRADEELRGYAAVLESNNIALEEFNGRAEAASRAKGQFLANMSHEIRTPMTAILGFTDILLADLKEPELIDAAQTVKRNGEHLLRLINDILDISKIEAGRMNVENMSWSPRQVVEDVVSLMHVRADAKGLTLRQEYEGPVPETITTDPARLRQILVNLVGNAIKFTDIGGVRIVTRLLQDAGEEPKLSVEVIDTGIGISEASIGQLFQPFTQVDASASRKYEGTGLGLSISRQLAQALGGDVTARSELGQGSTFTATIAAGPLEGVRLVEYLRETPPDDEHPNASMGEPRQSLHCRILLAEDIPDNQRLIASVLRKAGATVEIAHNGREAVNKAMATLPGLNGTPADPIGSFDVILMDMQMPLLDGYAATRRLRKEEYTGPIIALTAHAMTHDRQKCLDAGCNDFLSKPVDRKRLVKMVAQWATSRQELAPATGGHDVSSESTGYSA